YATCCARRWRNGHPLAFCSGWLGRCTGAPVGGSRSDRSCAAPYQRSKIAPFTCDRLAWRSCRFPRSTSLTRVFDRNVAPWQAELNSLPSQRLCSQGASVIRWAPCLLLAQLFATEPQRLCLVCSARLWLTDLGDLCRCGLSAVD